LKAALVKEEIRLRRRCEIFCQTIRKIRLKRSFEKLSFVISRNFNGAEFIIFYRFDKA
jgi:hypothetical protein